MKHTASGRLRESRGDRAFVVVNTALLALFGLVALYPLVYVLSASISGPTAVNSGQVILLPKDIQFEGYQNIFQSKWILTGYRNSALYMVGGTALNVLVTFMAAYALSRKDLFGKRVILLVMVIPMWFSGGLIPTFLTVQGFGLVNNPLVLIVLGAISMYNCIICRTFIQTSIPYELQEAAIIDGCSDFGIVWRIVFPLSGPVLAILTLYYGLAHWNEYFNALIYINDRQWQTLQIFLREILIQNKSITVNLQTASSSQLQMAAERAQMAQTMKYGLIVVASAPMLAIYPFVQKYFVQGVMLGAIKG